MRLNEGSIQISSQMRAKSLQEDPILALGLIFIEITRGPLCKNCFYFTLNGFCLIPLGKCASWRRAVSRCRKIKTLIFL